MWVDVRMWIWVGNEVVLEGSGDRWCKAANDVVT